MRILRVSQALYPDRTGGAPYHVHALSRDQAALGHDVTVLTTRTEPEQEHVEERAGYTILRFNPVASPLGNDLSPGLVRYLAQATDVDVVHAHSHLYFATNVAAACRVLDDTPLAITNHGLYSQSAPEWVFDIYLRTLGRWTFNRADVVFCYTETDECRVRDLGVSSRIEVVANGIDTGRFTAGGAESHLIDHNGPVVLFVGRLVEGKRPQVALEAFASLTNSIPGAQLAICGDGPLRQTLESTAIDLDLEGSVSFLGQVPYESMPAIYRSAEALVLPSRAEGVPRTILEALASGIPVVASDLEQVTPIVEAGGITAQVDDVDGFAAGLESVLTSPPSDPRAVVEREYHWSDTVERTTEVLQSLRSA